RAKRQGRPLSVMMADLDYLRRINNNSGHLAGDLVLIGVSEIIRRSVRSQDIVGRFGGEEFAILLPDTDQEEAFQVAEAVRQAIAETDFAIPTNPTPIRATMTLGIACFPDDATTATDLLHHADVAVYQAKMDGRNRVACASDLFYRIKSEGSFAAEESSTESSRKSESSVDQPPQPRLLDLPVHVPHLSTSMLEDEAMNLPGWYRWLSDTVLKSVMIAFALLLTMIGVSLQMATDWQAILVVVLLTAAAQFLRLKVFTSGDLPLAVALLFTAALITGVPGLALASAVIVFISALSETNFDSAQLWARKLDLANDWAIGLLAGLAPALLTPTFDVSLSIGYLPLLVVPFFLMMLAYSYTGISLIAFNVSVATKTSFARVWRDEFQSAPGQYMLMSFIGLCMALMYAMFGLTSFLLCVSTIFVMRLAQEPELVHKMHLEKLAAFLRQPLNSAGIYSNRKSYQHEPVATPVLLEADTARIERYLNFRDQARID
ncbi:MAG: GGDEF domain-containing protein, partial [Caldilineaceae bacterium]